MNDGPLDIATGIGLVLVARRRDGESGLWEVAKRIGSLFGGSCAVYLRSDSRQALVPVAAHQDDPGVVARLEEFMGASSSWSSQRVLTIIEALGSLLISGSPEQLDAFLGVPSHRHAVQTDLRSLLVVPVHAPETGLVGALAVGRHHRGRFELRDRDELSALAAGLADAFDQERVAWELRDRASRSERELSLARRRFTAAFHDSPVALALFTVGPGPAVLLEVNRRLTALLGTTQEALLAHSSPVDFLHPDDRPARSRAGAELLSGGSDVTRLEQRVLPADGPERLCQISISLVRDDAGKPQYGICQMLDITDTRRDEARLALHVRREAVLASIGRRALDGHSWKQLVVELVPELTAALDASEACVLVRTPEGGAAVVAGPAELALDEPLPPAPVRLEARRLPSRWLAHGSRSALVAPIGSHPEPRAWLALLGRGDAHLEPDKLEFVEAAAHLLAAAEERRAAAEDARRRATQDPLTGLPNRALFADRIAHALTKAARAKTALAVVCIDVDRFRDVNETFGHATGDDLIRALARQLNGVLRASDTLARIGGDEFGVLCEDVADERGAITAVRRLMTSLEPALAIDERSLHVAASFGVAVAADARVATAEGLLRDADTAMQRAKERHGITYELFDRAMRRRVVERLRLEQDLRRALEEQQFVLHYQPLVSLRKQQIVGVEALVRWQHPERGMISPAAFIPVAEDTGLIVGLGRWVLDAACRQLARWQADPALAPIYMSVNLSGRQLAVPGLAEEIEETLRRTGIAPQQLALELTESVLMEDTRSPAAVLQTLCDLGVRLLLDDFGTGYSSLNYVKRFPLHGLKIDRSFIAGIADDESDRAMLRAIVNMATALDIAVLAEGVETLEQASWLAGLDCEFAQGFGLARPARAEVIEPLLRDGLPPERLQWSSPYAPEPEPVSLATPSSEATVGLSEAADALGISASTLRRWADTGRLEAIRTPGGHRRFALSEVRRLSLRSGTGVRGELRTVQLPARPIPAVAELIAAQPELVPAAAASIYRPGCPGWFASEAGMGSLAQWVEALAAACRRGDFQAAVDATQRMLVQAEYGGASLLERCLVLDRCRDVVLRQLRDDRIPQADLLAARRLGFRLSWLAVELHEAP